MTLHEVTGKPSRYHLEAMAFVAADLVRHLGGLLFDRRGLGWDTTVLLDDCADVRPLQIIGADYAGLQPALEMPDHPRPSAIATSVQLYESDPRVRARVNAAIDSGLTEVMLWGEDNSFHRCPQMIEQAHRISRVAAVFKAHAVAAACAEASSDINVEKFLASRATWQSQAAPQWSAPRRRVALRRKP
jgi:HPt (histidine-containing phosphotransfer) domain-containing protein